MPKLMMHVEGLAVFLISIYFYAVNDFSWILFFILLFAPDLAMLGYAYNKRIGAIIYNVFHTYTASIAMIALGVILSSNIFLAVGLIWTAHIGMDRIVGYGLKYPNDFKDTHLQRI
ncbi:hypothetical protein CIL03_15695 [Virgibacillus indicus]|uniref:DUF4260 domain-containing protein n=1 Tax=Virgibacillus indicus TaxID=2024554 RepID=A0A265N6T7_9BACI|nr:DUF4260 domain-containing protein [Virgibacillus indicus]OZU87535.1 hypothetical protein CIL03_15695 [Virgibacillus indicus]